MGSGTYLPIDMPHDILVGLEQYDEATRAAVHSLIEKAHAEGRWRASEDILWNPQDIEFMAYWAQKCMDPLVEPMRGSGLKQRLAPYRRTNFDLKPEGFECKQSHCLSAAGDLMRAAHLQASQDLLYGGVSELIFGADCAYANLEFSIALGEPKDFSAFEQGGTPYMNVSQAEYLALTRHCGRPFDILQLANNHVLDWGEEGVFAMIETLRGDGIDYLGAYENEAAAAQPKITNVGDISIGWIAHTFSVNQKPLPVGKQWLVDITPFHVVPDPDTSRIEQQILAARAAGCELVIVCLHWGAEWEFYPLPGQLVWAHKFAELGADAIIGTHPGVIQPVEIYRPESDPEKAVPILYSLGNLTPSMGAPYTALSLVANLTLARGHLGGMACTAITGLQLTPVAFMAQRSDSGLFAACVPLVQLTGSGQEPQTQAYVSQMGEYADLVLGQDWRQAA